MTQHVFTTDKHSVLCGFDRPLQGFFLVIENLDETEVIYSNLDETDIELVHPRTFDHFKNVMSLHGIPVPYGLLDELYDDLAANRGNKIVDWGLVNHQLVTE